MKNLSPHAKGVIVTGLGVLVVSPDGLLARLIQTDLWTMIFWRALFLGIGLAVVVAVLFRGEFLARYRAIGWPGLWMALSHVIGMTAFMTAVTTTSVANTLLILATTPLFAALISWVTMREAMPLRTWLAIGLVAIGIAVISSGGDVNNASLTGDLAALLGAFMLGLGFTITRRYRDRSMIPALSLGGFFSALIIFPLATPVAVSVVDVGYLLLMGLFMLPLGMTMMYFGPRYVPAAEVGLMMLLESVVGPFWVWWALGENPGVRTFIGGGIILSALVVNLLWALNMQRRLSVG